MKIETRSIKQNSALTARYSFLWATLCALLFALYSSAKAQQQERIYRIGYLAVSTVHEDFRQGLRELGYIEGKNLIIEHRQAKTPEQYSELALELVNLKVDCILAVGVTAIRAAKQATGAIPIVMGNASDDPVRHRLVATLARPGANITGLIDMLPDMAGKRLALLKETFPKLTRVGHLLQRGRQSEWTGSNASKRNRGRRASIGSKGSSSGAAGS
jgi:putative ABC transport system substrate-binding protein